MHGYTVTVGRDGTVRSTRELHPTDARLLRQMVNAGTVLLAACAVCLLAGAALGVSNTAGNLVLMTLGAGTLVGSLRLRTPAPAVKQPAPKPVAAPTPPAPKPVDQPAPRCKCGAKVVQGKCLNRTCKHGQR